MTAKLIKCYFLCFLTAISLQLADAKFAYLTFNSDLTLSSSLLDDCRSENVVCLEPLQNRDYLCWISGPIDPKSHLFSVNADRVDTNRVSRTLQQSNPESVSGRIAIWVYEDGHANAGWNWINEHNGLIVHNSTVRMTANASYTVYGAIFPETNIQEFLGFSRLRFLYQESGTPEWEDEMSSLQSLINLSDPTAFTSVFEETKNLGATGSRTRIGIIDTGLETNDNETCHEDMRGRLTHFIRYPGSPTFDYVGHGTHVAGIIAGNGSLKSLDEYGFNLGIGIAHDGRLTISNALLSAPWPPSVGFQGVIRDIALTGARLCNNSWNDGEGIGIGYHPNCAIWDAAVRDSDPLHSFASSWPMTIVFSSGNQGPNLQSMTSPKEAKNIITVGAAGSLRGNNVDEILSLSSRGPCVDGRFAPNLSAPGDSIFSAWPVNAYFKLSGTSSAAAHVTGAAALLSEWWMDKTQSRPSPAMMKLLLILSTEIVTQSIPDTGHGWGRLNLSAFNPPFPDASFIDQNILFTLTGQEWNAHIIPISPHEPIDVVLAWTDPPAAPDANPALVNNLDLVIESTDLVFHGNNFNGVFSTTSGIADNLNNVERIRLPFSSTSLNLKVLATDIRGDGNPNNEHYFDQDFALVVEGGYLVSDHILLQTDKRIAAKNDRLTVMLSSLSDTENNEVSISVSSNRDKVGFDLILHSVYPGAGVFFANLFTGSCGRPNEISVSDADLITLKYEGHDNSTSISLPVDGVVPKIHSVEFEIITANDTRLSIGCSKTCDLTFHYKLATGLEWYSKKSDTLTHNHHIVISNLNPCTAYHGYFSIIDHSGNLTESTDYMDELQWYTANITNVYEEVFDNDPAFEELEGEWEWGQPLGMGIPPDPESGFTGQNVLGYNLSGNYSNRLPATHAVSPVIDCFDNGSYFLSYYRWLGTESGVLDSAVVSGKDENSLWHEIWQNPYWEVRDFDWEFTSINITHLAQGNENFQFRFTQGPTDGVLVRCGWNVDDIRIDRHVLCQPSPTPIFTTPKPTVSLISNNTIVLPGDIFRLSSFINTDLPTDYLALAIVLSSYHDGAEQMYFFPEWTPNPDWLDIRHPKGGNFELLITEFELPETIKTSIYVTFEAFLFDIENHYVFSRSDRVGVFFSPFNSTNIKLVDE